TPSYLELWFWHGFDPHGYVIELWDPWGELESSFEIGADASNIRKGEDPNRMRPILNNELEVVGQISADKHRPDFSCGDDKIGRWRVLIILAPTEPEDSVLPRAQSGKWTVVVKRGERARLIEQPIHCWIQRSVDPESLRSGSRQSYFDDWRNVRYRLDGDLK